MHRALLLACALAVSLPTAPAWADGALSEDPDSALATDYFALHLGSNLTTGAFGTVSLVAGIASFVAMGQGQGNSFFFGLTMTSMGVASAVSAATGAEGNVRVWKGMKEAFAGASDAERRLIREAEVARLQRMAMNRAIGLAADGTFLGLGIVLMVVNPSPDLGFPLVLDGGFLLGLDIFRLVVDDQIGKDWAQRNRDADAGYFSSRRAPPSLQVAALPILAPDGLGGWTLGGTFVVGGRF